MQRLLIVWLFVIPLYANIDTQIDAIQNAPIEERFKLMNTLKKDMMKMQNKERINAITKLKTITNSPHSSRVLKELRKNTKPDSSTTRTSPKIHKRAKVYHREKDPIENEIEHHSENATEEQIENTTEDHIENETEDHIENETEDHIEDDHDDDD